MRPWSILILLAFLLVGLAVPRPAAAHEGHDHDKPTPLALPIAPRVVAITPDYEVVGVLSGKSRLTIFVTTFATNAPVKDASVVVAAGEQRATADAKGDGVFELTAPWLAGAGKLELVFELALPVDQDLLTGTLDRGALSTVEAAPDPSRALLANPIWLAVFLGGLVFGVLGALLFRKTSLSSQQSNLSERPNGQASPEQANSVKPLRRIAGALVIFCALASDPLSSAHAADMAKVNTPSVPSTMATDLAQRLADGTLFVPKATQHLLSVRTMLASETDAPKSVELPGAIVPGPQNFSRVQSGHTGRLEAPDGGLGYVGQHVNKGDVLGYLIPHLGVLERGGVQSQIAETDARIEAQKAKLARYRGAPLAIPPIKIDEAEGELQALQDRRRELNPTLTERHEIRAPISGIVSKAGFFAGQAIDPRDVLFEIVDPSEFWVEAIAYDTTAIDGSGEASATFANRSLPLEFIGRGLTLREQAAPLMFKIKAATEGLSIGQPVKVVLQSTVKTKGFVVPSSSITRGQSGLPIVWVKTDAERFEPQTVKVAPLDGTNIVILAGVKADARIVTEGVTLLNQIR